MFSRTLFRPSIEPDIQTTLAQWRQIDFHDKGRKKLISIHPLPWHRLFSLDMVPFESPIFHFISINSFFFLRPRRNFTIIRSFVYRRLFCFPPRAIESKIDCFKWFKQPPPAAREKASKENRWKFRFSPTSPLQFSPMNKLENRKKASKKIFYVRDKNRELAAAENFLRVILKKEKLLRAFTAKSNDNIFQSGSRESSPPIEGE